jgi:SAM-dependent methyltransferase
LSIDLSIFIYNILNNKKDENNNSEKEEKNVKNDLVSLQQLFKQSIGGPKKQFRILELGCGHSLPTLSVLRLIEHELSRDTTLNYQNIEIIIYLQDFNKEILQNITQKNVKRFISNTKPSSFSNVNAHFIYGDWKKLYSQQDLIPHDYFDLILSSETIYNSLNYKHLMNLFSACLRKDNPNSCILLSQKSYYFGCGGNLFEFLKLAQTEKYSFKVSQNLLQIKSTEKDNKDDCSIKGEDTTISKEIIRIHF